MSKPPYYESKCLHEWVHLIFVVCFSCFFDLFFCLVYFCIFIWLVAEIKIVCLFVYMTQYAFCIYRDVYILECTTTCQS